MDNGWFYTTADRVITEEDVYLLQVIVTNDGDAGTSGVTVYDGTGTGGKKIGRFSAIQHDSNPIPFPDPGIRCPHGIYVDLETNVEGVLVIYRTIKHGL